MKVKMISRNPDDYQRETNKDIYKIVRNWNAPQDPFRAQTEYTLVRNWNAPQDPFRAQTEYTRALNATKLERVFAKPFVASLDGHMEGVHILVKHPDRPSIILSGARDGQVKVWALARRHCLATFQTHNGPVNGTSESVFDVFLSIQTRTYGVALAVSHIANSSEFVTCGDGVTVWGAQGSKKIREYDVGHDTVHTVRANPIEEAVLVGACSDRSIFVIDTRQAVPLTKVTMKLRPNQIAWNPIEPYTFSVANDDYK
ncbi:unnamed protein product [Strongylus vulgaris]|uniref:Uncharacterized protein n=1 Tax=Strongylus vulgaris TaxID=40348 RepID=A0A3P7J0F6_STRVU|nr:unnamed protein product [Strongylus vulgaris]